MSAATKAEHAALLRAAMQTGRTLVGGVTHDLNSALQILGDSLYAIKDDTQALLRAAPSVSDETTESLSSSLALADDAFSRITAITRVVPGLVVTPNDESGPINVEAELCAVVALTRHHWKHRLNVLIDMPTPFAPFWCKWWIVRLAAMRMVMLASESQQRAPSKYNADRLPTLRITGVLDTDSFELRMCLEQAPLDSTTMAADSVLTLCAKCLNGSIEIVAAHGSSLTSIRYPVRLTSAPTEAGLP